MAVESITYKTYETCKKSLLKMGVCASELEELLEILEHEKSHFDKAVSLGYSPKYGLRMIADFPPIILAGYIDFDGRVPAGQDMIDILLAPKIPGEHDYIFAEKIRSELVQQ